MSKRLVIIAAATLLTGALFFGFLLYLDSIPENKYHEAPNIFKQEYLKLYNQDSAESISPVWSYEHFHEIATPALSPDGNLVYFLGKIDEQPALVCLNNKGERIWLNRNITCCTNNELRPRILVLGEYILLYWIDQDGGPGDDTNDRNMSLFNSKGELLWSKPLWGKPIALSSSNGLIVSRYTKRFYDGDERLKDPAGCVDPEMRNLAGGDAVGFDMRGTLVDIDLLTGSETDLNVVGVDSISVRGNYLVSSCIGRTTVFGRKLERLNSAREYGLSYISLDEKSMVIRSLAQKTEEDLLDVFDLKENKLWSKKISRFYPPRWEVNSWEDRGIMELLGSDLKIAISPFLKLNQISQAEM